MGKIGYMDFICHLIQAVTHLFKSSYVDVGKEREPPLFRVVRQFEGCLYTHDVRIIDKVILLALSL